MGGLRHGQRDRGLDLTEGRAAGWLAGHAGGVVGLAASPADPLLVTAGHDRTLRIWDTRASEAFEDVPADHVIRTVEVVDQAGVAAAEYADGRRAAWTLERGEPAPANALGLTTPSNDRGRDMWAPSRDGRRAAKASWETPMFGMFTMSEVTGQDSDIPALIEIVDATTGAQVAAVTDPHGPLTALAMSHAGDRVIAASWDGGLSVWSIANRDLERRLPVGATTADFALVTRGRSAEQMVDTLAVANAAVAVMVVTADDTLIVASRNASLQEWDLASGRLLAVTILEAPAVDLALGPDDASVVVADERGRISYLARVAAGPIAVRAHGRP